MTRNKRLMGFAMRLLPARTFRTIGTTVMMNRIGRIHKKPNNTMGKPSLKFRLLTTSMIMNGRMMNKLMSTSDPMVLSMVCIITPEEIRSRCSIKIPMVVSMNVHSTNPKNLSFTCRFSSHRSLNVCSVDSASCSLKPFG